MYNEILFNNAKLALEAAQEKLYEKNPELAGKCLVLAYGAVHTLLKRVLGARKFIVQDKNPFWIYN